MPPSTVDQLKVYRRQIRDLNVTFSQWGGHKIEYFVDVPDVALGVVALKSKQFLVLPNDFKNSSFAGYLAPDFLHRFDVDFAAAKRNLFLQDRCPGDVVYWTAGTPAVVN